MSFIFIRLRDMTSIFKPMSRLLNSILFVFASVAIVNAQCNEFYVLQEGSEWEYQTFNPKGKMTGKSVQKVADFSKNSNGFVATVNSAIFDDKNKEVAKGDMNYKCENGTMYLDMRNFLSEEQMKAFSSYEMKVEGTNLEIPSKLSPGQTLGDGTVTITAIGAPFPLKTTRTITDRKVEAKESITTPAGTFECYKISSKTLIESQMGVKISTQLSTTEWIAPKVGTVKSESFNKSGKSMGYTLLSKRVN
jgi:hypothetical protein